MFSFKQVNGPRLTRKERQFDRSGKTPHPAWLRYRVACRIVRDVMGEKPSGDNFNVYKANDEWQLKLFVRQVDGLTIGFCCGKLANAMQRTFLPAGILLLYANAVLWRQLMESDIALSSILRRIVSVVRSGDQS